MNALLLAAAVAREGAAASTGPSTTTWLVLLAGLSLLPFAFVTLTAFTKVSVVLSITKNALGSGQLPPPMVITGLSLALTLHVMAPVGEQMHALGSAAWASSADSTEGLLAAAQAASAPLHTFLLEHASAADREAFARASLALRKQPREPTPEESTGWSVLVPAFLVGQLGEAFRLGFLVFLPFLALDVLVANVLTALGLTQLQAPQVALPFKLLLFVTAGGWSLLGQGLVLGYAGATP